MQKFVLEPRSKMLAQYQSRESVNRLLRPPKHRDDFDRYKINPMGIVRAPVLKSLARAPEWGLNCVTCRFHRADYGFPYSIFHWRRKFTRESFEDHIRECGEIINGRHTKFGTSYALRFLN